MTEVSRRSARQGRLWLGLVALLVAGLAAAAAGVLATRIRDQVTAAEARASAAESLAVAASRSADAQVAAAREDASREIAGARDAALRAQTIGDVLAAPDLARYSLIGGDGVNVFRGQALWSRSRGFVFTATRLPEPPPDTTYQIWLLTGGQAVSAGVFVPDAAGRATVATDAPPAVPPPVSGISVTIEPAGGVAQPTGRRILALPPRAG